MYFLSKLIGDFDSTKLFRMRSWDDVEEECLEKHVRFYGLDDVTWSLNDQTQPDRNNVRDLLILFLLPYFSN